MKNRALSTCSAIAKSFAASVAASSRAVAIVVEDEIAESKSIGGGGNVKCSSAKVTYVIKHKNLEI